MYNFNIVDMGIKPGPKRIAVSTGKPDRRQRDNKQTPRNTPSLKPGRVDIWGDRILVKLSTWTFWVIINLNNVSLNTHL